MHLSLKGLISTYEKGCPTYGLVGGDLVNVVMMTEDDPRERRWSLMMLDGPVGRVMTDHLMSLMMSVMIRIVGVAVVVVRSLSCLTLTRLLVLHPPILKPYLHLSLGQIQIPRELPSLLLRDVGIEEELLLELECLEFGVGLAFLSNCHLTSPFEGIITNSHPGHSDSTKGS